MCINLNCKFDKDFNMILSIVPYVLYTILYSTVFYTVRCIMHCTLLYSVQPQVSSPDLARICQYGGESLAWALSVISVMAACLFPVQLISILEQIPDTGVSLSINTSSLLLSICRIWTKVKEYKNLWFTV